MESNLLLLLGVPVALLMVSLPWDQVLTLLLALDPLLAPGSQARRVSDPLTATTETTRTDPPRHQDLVTNGREPPHPGDHKDPVTDPLQPLTVHTDLEVIPDTTAESQSQDQILSRGMDQLALWDLPHGRMCTRRSVVSKPRPKSSVEWMLIQRSGNGWQD